MNNLMLFEGQYEVLILTKNDLKFDFHGDFLILAKSVSKALEYARTEEVTKFCKEGQVFIVRNSDLSISVNRRIRKLHNTGEAFITNLALNRVFGKSEKPKAEPFQDWLYEDMLPSIQKHGAYLTPDKVEEVLLNPDTIIHLANQIKVEREEKEKALKTLEIQRPKVIYAEAVTVSRDTVLVKDLAAVLKQKGVDIGEKRLFSWLRDNGYLCKRKGDMWNMPTQRSLDLRLIEIKHGLRTGNNGEMKKTRTPKITGKGQIYFVNKFLAKENVI
ncbi:phage antirepressor KilAC domain-containing protein [Bacillus chungangensis]|uniref:Phage antirepressor YoqD-like protein n=1 Tax=Bacillus chungangensis TaxID=587633 RepID=A0ABT9WS62_9BACI|nr:phage antirepressor KilAC domain-containing protein [Bacillus chungangensis]MDQ0175983.1 phage antirepressor YoqD-like protein [Bacillus chungangensis]